MLECRSSRKDEEEEGQGRKEKNEAAEKSRMTQVNEERENGKPERGEGAHRIETVTGTLQHTPQSFPGNGGFLNQSGRRIVKEGRSASSLLGHCGGCSRSGPSRTRGRKMMATKKTGSLRS